MNALNSVECLPKPVMECMPFELSQLFLFFKLLCLSWGRAD